MALTLNSTLHMRNGQAVNVVETIQQILALMPPSPSDWPPMAGVNLTVANGDKIWVSLAAVDWMEKK